MPVPPPIPDPTHIETRLLLVAEMLDRAVAEVRRTMDQLKAGKPADPEHDQSGGVDA
jgi:signal transduction histidine kinase